MARARNIKPAFFLNTDLSEIEPLGRLLFIGLWTIADYKGCIECNLKKIKAQILPYDNCDLELLANNLEQFRFIRYYFVQGIKYIKIDNFIKHQNPHKNEKQAGSNLPDITEKDNEIIQMSNYGTKPDKIGSTRADSLLLIPSTLIPETLVTAKPRKQKKVLNYDDYPEFVEFWNIYPSKESKYKSLELWVKIKPPIQKIVNALAWQVKTSKWQDNNYKYVPHAVTYLNQRRWDDEPIAERMAF